MLKLTRSLFSFILGRLFKKSLLNLLQYCFCFMFQGFGVFLFWVFFFCPRAQWDPSSLTKDWTPRPLLWKEVSTTGPPGKSLIRALNTALKHFVLYLLSPFFYSPKELLLTFSTSVNLSTSLLLTEANLNFPWETIPDLQWHSTLFIFNSFQARGYILCSSKLPSHLLLPPLGNSCFLYF